jgi:hypothetical protein
MENEEWKTIKSIYTFLENKRMENKNGKQDTILIH